MTEAEWLAATDPDKLLDSLEANQSGRKLRLFAVACWREIWELVDSDAQRLISIAEQHADDAVPLKQRVEAVVSIAEKPGRSPDWRGRTVDGRRYVRSFAAMTDTRLTDSGTVEGISQPSPSDSMTRIIMGPQAASSIRNQYLGMGTFGRLRERLFHVLNRPTYLSWDGAYTSQPEERQSDLFRDIFVNPFRPVSVDPSWLTSTVVALANGIYAERAFDRMPILADALQDAGCDNDDVLNHCRGDGPHVRGCWVVDLLLGKS